MSHSFPRGCSYVAADIPVVAKVRKNLDKTESGGGTTTGVVGKLIQLFGTLDAKRLLEGRRAATFASTQNAAAK
jgi:hypothetical protein